MKLMKTLMRATAVMALMATAASAADIAVIGGSNDDAFWNKIKKGLDDATPGVVANGGTVNYLRLVNYDNFAPDVVQLIRTAISMEVDGLVIPNWMPEAEDPAIKEAIAAGITVILMNAGGADKAHELGAINYIGNEEYPAGVAGGEYFASHGQKNLLCVNTLPGATNTDPLQGCGGRNGGRRRCLYPASVADHFVWRRNGGCRSNQGRTAER